MFVRLAILLVVGIPLSLQAQSRARQALQQILQGMAMASPEGRETLRTIQASRLMAAEAERIQAETEQIRAQTEQMQAVPAASGVTPELVDSALKAVGSRHRDFPKFEQRMMPLVQAFAWSPDAGISYESYVEGLYFLAKAQDPRPNFGPAIDAQITSSYPDLLDPKSALFAQTSKIFRQMVQRNSDRADDPYSLLEAAEQAKLSLENEALKAQISNLRNGEKLP